MEVKSDMAKAIEVLEDEIKGVESYSKMLETATCPKLKKLLVTAIADEKKHANLFLEWINNSATSILR